MSPSHRSSKITEDFLMGQGSARLDPEGTHGGGLSNFHFRKFKVISTASSPPHTSALPILSLPTCVHNKVSSSAPSTLLASVSPPGIHIPTSLPPSGQVPCLPLSILL